MTLKILDLKGNHYFFIRDKRAEDCLKNSFLLAESLQSNRNIKSEERVRNNLKENLSYSIGFRKAEKVANQDVKEIFSVLHEEAERRREYREVHERLFNRAVKEAWRKHSNPRGYAAEQIKRDSIYHTLQRSGLANISEMLGHSDGLTLTDQLIRGNRLTDIVDEKLLTITEVLPFAMLFSTSRRELEDRLSSYDLDDEQISKIIRNIPFDQKAEEVVNELMENLDIGEEALREAVQTYLFSRGKFEGRFQKFTSRLNLSEAQREKAKEILYRSLRRASRIVDYARTVEQLSVGNLNLEWVLSRSYTRSEWYPLACIIQNLGFKRYNIQHFHTSLAGYMNRCYTYYYAGRDGIPNKLLTFLEEISGIESKISRWDTPGGITILYPKKEIPSTILGTLYGLFILGHGIKEQKELGWQNRLFYSNHKRSEDSLIDMLEKVGLLRTNLYFRLRTSKFFEKAFGKRPTNTYYKEYNIPFQYYGLITHVSNEEFKDKEFTRFALKMWIEERGRHYSYRGYSTSIKQKYESEVRKLASTVGLSLSNGYVVSRCKSKKGVYIRVYIRNPEVLEIGG